MLKLISFIRRSPGLDPQAFDRHWCDVHGPLIRRHAALLGIRRYIQNVGRTDDGLQLAMEAGRGLTPFDYDGSAELWWDSADAYNARRSTPAGRAALAEIVADEARFVDLGRSLFWFCDERPIIPIAGHPRGEDRGTTHT